VIEMLRYAQHDITWSFIFGQRLTLRDTVGKPARRSKMREGGYHVLENTITLADAGRNGADREEDNGRA